VPGSQTQPSRVNPKRPNYRNSLVRRRNSSLPPPLVNVFVQTAAIPPPQTSNLLSGPSPPSGIFEMVAANLPGCIKFPQHQPIRFSKKPQLWFRSCQCVWSVGFLRGSAAFGSEAPRRGTCKRLGCRGRKQSIAWGFLRV